MEFTPKLVTNGSEEVASQRQSYSNAIGGDTPTSDLEDLLKFAEDAELPAFYLKKQEEDLWYEMLDKDGLAEKVGAIADKWAEASSF